uniref:RRM domain-containing protein n=1 Tax=Anopheles farauti TaxID=69004 RepID=A0A182R187_9DIPT
MGTSALVVTAINAPRIKYGLLAKVQSAYETNKSCQGANKKGTGLADAANLATPIRRSPVTALRVLHRFFQIFETSPADVVIFAVFIFLRPTIAVPGPADRDINPAPAENLQQAVEVVSQDMKHLIHVGKTKFGLSVPTPRQQVSTQAVGLQGMKMSQQAVSGASHCRCSGRKATGYDLGPEKSNTPIRQPVDPVPVEKLTRVPNPGAARIPPHRGVHNAPPIESVDLALKILDNYDVRGHKIKVQRAEFQMRGEYNPTLKPKMRKKEKERLKKMQESLFDWRPEKMRGERSKHERIVIIKNLFEPELFDREVHLLLEYQNDLREECGKCGTVRRVLLYDRHPEGVAQVTMGDPEEADLVVKLMDGRFFGQRKLTAAIWDGRTKYRIAETDADIDKRRGNWEQFLETDEAERAKGNDTDEEEPSAAKGATAVAEQTVQPEMKSDLERELPVVESVDDDTKTEARDKDNESDQEEQKQQQQQQQDQSE